MPNPTRNTLAAMLNRYRSPHIQPELNFALYSAFASKGINTISDISDRLSQLDIARYTKPGVTKVLLSQINKWEKPIPNELSRELIRLFDVVHGTTGESIRAKRLLFCSALCGHNTMLRCEPFLAAKSALNRQFLSDAINPSGDIHIVHIGDGYDWYDNYELFIRLLAYHSVASGILAPSTLRRLFPYDDPVVDCSRPPRIVYIVPSKKHAILLWREITADHLARKAIEMSKTGRLTNTHIRNAFISNATRFLNQKSQMIEVRISQSHRRLPFSDSKAIFMSSSESISFFTLYSLVNGWTIKETRRQTAQVVRTMYARDFLKHADVQVKWKDAEVEVIEYARRELQRGENNPALTKFNPA